MDLKGRTALITGSTSGIGLGIAKVLASHGANIIINGFGDAADIEKERSNLEACFGIRAWYVAADLSNPEGARQLVREAIGFAGKVDILVNNAGIQHTAPIEEFAQEKWDLILSLMLTAPYAAISEVLPHMRSNKWGRIINIASVHGLVASVNKAAYVSAKHGLVGLTKVVALESAKTGVTCNAICPGWVLTPLVQQQIDAIAKKEGISNEAAKDKLLSEKQPSGDFATAEEIGGLTAFLCSDVARQVRGSVYVMDGGWTAQ